MSQEKHDIASKKAGKLDFISSVDPIAEALIREHYKLLKNKENDDSQPLTKEERAFLQGIENTYDHDKGEQEKKLNSLIEQVTQVFLKDAEWSSEEQELYKVLADIMSLEHKHKDFFDNIEKTIEEMLRLNHRVEAPLRVQEKNPNNLLNFLPVVLNLLREKYGTSTVSTKVVNTLLSELTTSAVLVTNLEGDIRFVNTTSEKLFGIKNEEVATKGSIKTLLVNFDAIKQDLVRLGSIENRQVEVAGHTNSEASFFLNVLNLVKDDFEVTEIIWLLSKEKISKSENGFDFTLENDPVISIVNDIIGAANYLNDKKLGNSTARMTDIIYQRAWELKEKLQGDLKPVSLASAAAGMEPIGFEELIGVIVHFYGKNDKSLQFHTLIEVEGVFLSNPKHLLNVIKQIINYRCEYKKSHLQMNFDIVIKSASCKGICITIHDNGTVIDKADQELSENTKLKEVHQIITEKLKGSISVRSDSEKGTTFEIQLSHLL